MADIVAFFTFSGLIDSVGDKDYEFEGYETGMFIISLMAVQFGLVQHAIAFGELFKQKRKDDATDPEHYVYDSWDKCVSCCCRCCAGSQFVCMIGTFVMIVLLILFIILLEDALGL